MSHGYIQSLLHRGLRVVLWARINWKITCTGLALLAMAGIGAFFLTDRSPKSTFCPCVMVEKLPTAGSGPNAAVQSDMVGP